MKLAICLVPRKGVDAGDHPPITPMKSATETELGHDAFRLYDYITRHFIATVSKSSLAFFLSWFLLLTYKSCISVI